MEEKAPNALEMAAKAHEEGKEKAKYSKTMTEKPECTTKHERITNARGSVQFPCPGCNFPIVRSSHARKLGAQYTCPKCGFLGPN